MKELADQPVVDLNRDQCRAYLPPGRVVPVAAKVYLVRGVKYNWRYPTTLSFVVDNGMLEVGCPVAEVDPKVELIKQPFVYFSEAAVREVCFKYVGEL